MGGNTHLKIDHFFEHNGSDLTLLLQALLEISKQEMSGNRLGDLLDTKTPLIGNCKERMEGLRPTISLKLHPKFSVEHTYPRPRLNAAYCHPGL